MNGNSFAALLGVATWFGSKPARKEAAPAGSSDTQRDSDEADDYREFEWADRPDFIWPSGPMFQ